MIYPNDNYSDIIAYDENIHPRNPKEYPYEKVEDTESFIRKSLWIHGIGRYDYNSSIYSKASVPLEITCHNKKKHASPHTFYRRPNDHISKAQGCPKCSGKYRWTTEEWISEATKKWNDEFDYNGVEYVSAFSKITITHRACDHVFSVTPDNHMRGRGCPNCKKTRLPSMETSDEWIDFFRSIHGNKYSYDEFKNKYKFATKKLPIWCNTHNEYFMMSPKAHKEGYGCRKCGKEKSSVFGNGGLYKTDRPALLYILNFDDQFIKVGVTVDIDIRLRTLKRETGMTPTILYSVYGPANEVVKLEKTLIYHSGLNSYDSGLEFRGKTECVELNDIQIIEKVLSKNCSKLITMKGEACVAI